MTPHLPNRGYGWTQTQPHLGMTSRLSSHACLVSNMITNGILEERDYNFRYTNGSKRLSRHRSGYEGVNSDITHDWKPNWSQKHRWLSVCTTTTSNPNFTHCWRSLSTLISRFLSRFLSRPLPRFLFRYIISQPSHIFTLPLLYQPLTMFHRQIGLRRSGLSLAEGHSGTCER